MIAAWVVLLLVSVAGASAASRQAVGSALRVAEMLKISPALVGLTVLAIGTDLPEIANSIVSSAGGHGDVNVGDSMGSAMTQVTLTLGLLCLAGGAITANRSFVLAVGAATVFAAVTARVLVDDGQLSRLDGLIFASLWLGGTALLGRGELRPREILRRDGDRTLGADLAVTIGWLAVVGLFAVGVIESFLRITEALGVPEFVASFIALAIGTSLPELFVDWTAIRRGASAMAVGDIFGSSFVDTTLSIGIGPALFPVAVTSAASTGTLLAAVGVLAATAVVARADRYGRAVAGQLLAVYAVVQLLAVAAA